VISGVDLAVIALYLLAVTLFGMRFRNGDRSLKSYFLGSATVPWWAISLSIVAAETSTLTLVSVPGIAYQGDFSFLQLAMGYICGRIVISALLIPQFFKREIFTAYEWIEFRFGKRLQKITAGVFLLTRAAAEGVRVFAVSIVMSIAFHLSASLGSDALAIGGVIVLTLLYTYHGGLNAVIWTDVLQIGIYTSGSLIGLSVLIHLIPGGWDGFFQSALAANKFQVFNFSLNFYQPYTFLAGLIGGTFLTTASHGTDQLLVQRLLATRSEHKAKLALISSGFLVFIQFAFYLTIGAALFVFDQSAKLSGASGSTPGSPPVRSDHIFPEFIVHHMPEGVRGLLIAAILAAAMSNLSAALNSLASTSVMDFYRSWYPQSDEKKLVQLSHKTTLFWALVLFVLAMLTRNGGRVVETGLAIASVTYGGLLGVFLAGRLTEKVGEGAAIMGLIAGLLVNISVWTWTTIAFPWYVPLGSLTTLMVAWTASRVFDARTELLS
jgi:SSS family solute:Na+ symporter